MSITICLKGHFSILVIEHVLSNIQIKSVSDKHVTGNLFLTIHTRSGLSVPVSALGKLPHKVLSSKSAGHLRKCDN